MANTPTSGHDRRKTGACQRAQVPLLLLFLVCFIPNLLAEEVNPIRRVVILNEVDISYPLINLIDQGIRNSVTDSPYQIEFYREYMETALFPDAADQQLFRDFYIHRYQTHRPDLIITVGPAPLEFMIETHRKFFSGIPVVFCLPNKLPGYSITDPDFTGIGSDIAPGLTVAAALRLVPGTKHVLVVGGTAPYDRGQQAEVKEQLKNYENRLDISYLTDFSLPYLLERLKQLPSQTIVLLTPVGRDTTGRTFKSSEIAPLIMSAANAPVFSLTDRYLNHGEVGGDISSGIEQGELAGKIAMRVLEGEKPKDVSTVSTTSHYTFDWKALKRWGLKEKNLPPNSIVLNRQPTVWDSHKWYIAGGIALILLEAFLISGLLWQRARRRKAEASLGISNEHLRLAVSAGRSVGWEWDVNSGQNQWFGDLQTMFGISSDIYCGTAGDFQRRVHPEDWDFVSAAITNARESHERYVAEFRVLRDDGVVRWVTAIGKFYYGINGVPERMLGMAIDITDRKKVEQKLTESEQRFRLVANTAPVMIWMSGTNGLRNYFNKPWLDFAGRSSEQEVGNGWTDGIHVEDLAGFMDVYVERFEARQEFELQYRLRRHDGEYRWLAEVGIPRFSPDGTFAGYIGSAVDITERKIAEEALASIGRRLIEAHEEERARIGRELHDDINQRLALLAVELDSWNQSVSVKPDLHQHLQDAKRRIAEIANDVQALSHQLHSSKLEYLGLATAAKSFCREISEKNHVRIHFTQDNVPRDLPQEVSLCLFRVMQEALQNAFKHSGQDHFEVQLRGTPGVVQLTIRDSGRGFDINEAMQGRGLGLISMRERVGLVKGRIAITSKQLVGTEITVLVPTDTGECIEAVSGAA